MEWYELLGVGLALLVVAYVVLRRALNVTIASWVAQLPQLISQVSGAVQLPKVKIMDAIGGGLMSVLSDPNVRQALSQGIVKAIRGIGGQKQLPPPPPGVVPPG
jgi:type II secretory pathway component PulM